MRTGDFQFRHMLAQERIRDWNEFHHHMEEKNLREQGARCMDCGIPFCHTGTLLNGMASGCPINNLIPEWNDLVYRGLWSPQTKYPVQYPTACSPQAWSTGTPLLLLRTMLGLEPHGDHLVVDPALPLSIGHLELLDIPGRWGRIDAFGRGRVDVRKRTSRR